MMDPRPATILDHDVDEGGLLTMCKPIQCENCGKITWTGCGEHVEQVRAQVRAEDWCTCGE